MAIQYLQDDVRVISAWCDNNEKIVVTEGEGYVYDESRSDKGLVDGNTIKSPCFQLKDDNGVVVIPDQGQNDVFSDCVYLAIRRSDGTEALFNCIVLDGAKGLISIPIEIGITKLFGKVKGEIRFITSNSVVKFYGINFYVNKGVSDNAAQQSESFTALVEALQKIVLIIPAGDVGTLSMDTTIQHSGTNPVASGVIYDFVDGNFERYKIISDDEVDTANDSNTIYTHVVQSGFKGLVFFVGYNNYGGSETVKQYRLCKDGRFEYRTGTVVVPTTTPNIYTWDKTYNENWNPIGSADNIQDSAIITSKIYNSAVTTEKINDGAITSQKIANNAVTTNKLADDSVTPDKLDRSYVPSARNIAGIDLQDDITDSELRTALNINDIVIPTAEESADWTDFIPSTFTGHGRKAAFWDGYLWVLYGVFEEQGTAYYRWDKLLNEYDINILIDSKVNPKIDDLLINKQTYKSSLLLPPQACTSNIVSGNSTQVIWYYGQTNDQRIYINRGINQQSYVGKTVYQSCWKRPYNNYYQSSNDSPPASVRVQAVDYPRVDGSTTKCIPVCEYQIGDVYKVIDTGKTYICTGDGFSCSFSGNNLSEGIYTYIWTEIEQDLANVELQSNKVTSISSSSTDTQYASAKCVFSFVNNSILNKLNIYIPQQASDDLPPIYTPNTDVYNCDYKTIWCSSNGKRYIMTSRNSITISGHTIYKNGWKCIAKSDSNIIYSSAPPVSEHINSSDYNSSDYYVYCIPVPRFDIGDLYIYHSSQSDDRLYVCIDRSINVNFLGEDMSSADISYSWFEITDTYTKSEIDTMIGDIETLLSQV